MWDGHRHCCCFPLQRDGSSETEGGGPKSYFDLPKHDQKVAGKKCKVAKPGPLLMLWGLEDGFA